MCKASPCDAAHLPCKAQGAMGSKVGDDKTVPLCRECHQRQHQIGHKAFWGEHMENALKLAEKLYSAKTKDVALWATIGWKNDI